MLDTPGVCRSSFTITRWGSRAGVVKVRTALKVKHNEVVQRQECRARNYHDKKGALHSGFVTLQSLPTSAQNLVPLGLNTYLSKGPKFI